MAGEALLVTQFLAAGLMLLLAAWMLYLSFHSRVVRAFSLFLLLRAMNILCNQFARIFADTTGPFGPEYWLGVRGYFDLAVVPSLAWFLLVYARQKEAGTLRLGGWAMLLLTVGLELAYAANHCVALCRSDGLLQVGPLGPLMFGAVVAYAVIGFVLVGRAKGADGHAKSAAFLVAAAFFLHAIFEVAVFFAGIFTTGIQAALDRTFVPNFWQPSAIIAAALAVIPILLTAVAFVTKPTSAIRRGHIWVVLVLATAEIGLAWLLANVEQIGPYVGPIRAIFPILVVLAILRHRMFGVNVRIRAGISRGTVAGIFLATFFAVSKVVENIVADQFKDANPQIGIYVGGAAAGVLLFAISPLQRLGERVATVTTSWSEPPGSRKEQLRFYRDQAEIAWGDGVLGKRERMLLTGLREQLGLTLQETEEVERRLVESLPTGNRKPLPRPTG